MVWYVLIKTSNRCILDVFYIYIYIISYILIFFSASIFIIGSIFGSIGGGLTCQFLGKKGSMMIENVVVICGLLCIIFADGIPLLFFGRFLTGYANGSTMSSILPYTGEVCQPKIRKFTGTLFTMCFTIGYAVMYILGAAFSWRDAVTIIGIVPIISFVLLFLCPESPSWLLSKGKEREAYDAMFKLRGDSDIVEVEMDRLKQNMEKQKEQHQKSGNNNSSKFQTLKDEFTSGTVNSIASSS